MGRNILLTSPPGRRRRRTTDEKCLKSCVAVAPRLSALPLTTPVWHKTSTNGSNNCPAMCKLSANVACAAGQREDRSPGEARRGGSGSVPAELRGKVLELPGAKRDYRRKPRAKTSHLSPEFLPDLGDETEATWPALTGSVSQASEAAPRPAADGGS